MKRYMWKLLWIIHRINNEEIETKNIQTQNQCPWRGCAIHDIIKCGTDFNVEYVKIIETGSCYWKRLFLKSFYIIPLCLVLVVKLCLCRLLPFSYRCSIRINFSTNNFNFNVLYCRTIILFLKYPVWFVWKHISVVM